MPAVQDQGEEESTPRKEEEEIAEEAGEEEHEKLALEQTESFIPPPSPTYEQPAEFGTPSVDITILPNTGAEADETIDVESESKSGIAKEEEDGNQEGVALELPVTTEDGLMEEDIVLNKEEEAIPENIEQEHIEEQVLSQPESAIVSRDLEHVEQFADQVELPSFNAEDQVEEAVAREVEFQQDIPIEAYGQEETTFAPVVSVEEVSKDEGESITTELNNAVLVTPEREEIQEGTSDQEVHQTRPASPQFEHSESPLELTPSNIPEAEVAEREDLKVESQDVPVQDTEQKQSGEQAPDEPESLTVALPSSDIEQLAEKEPQVDDIVNAESGKSSTEQLESFTVPAEVFPVEQVDHVELHSPTLPPSQIKSEVAETVTEHKQENGTPAGEAPTMEEEEKENKEAQEEENGREKFALLS